MIELLNLVVRSTSKNGNFKCIGKFTSLLEKISAAPAILLQAMLLSNFAI